MTVRRQKIQLQSGRAATAALRIMMKGKHGMGMRDRVADRAARASSASCNAVEIVGIAWRVTRLPSQCMRAVGIELRGGNHCWLYIIFCDMAWRAWYLENCRDGAALTCAHGGAR